MDQCLRMPELLSNIFYHLASPGPVDIIPEHATFPIISRENAKFFADLARTCQAFSEPALDRLWHFQANLTPLFGTLPPGVVYAYKNGIVVRLFCLFPPGIDLELFFPLETYTEASRRRL